MDRTEMPGVRRRIRNLDELLSYLGAPSTEPSDERLRLLLFDAENRLLHDTAVAVTACDAGWFCPGLVLGPVLRFDAAAVILVHYPRPEPVLDAAYSRPLAELWRLGRILDLRLHDHVFASPSGWTSFRAEGLI